MSEHPQSGELFELYALGLLAPGERAELEQHLQGGCAVCEQDLRRALSLTAAIGAAGSPVEPSARATAGLRRRLAPAAAPAAPGRWRWAAAVIVLALAAAWFGWRTARLQTANRMLRVERNALQEQLRHSQESAAEAQAALALLSAPDTRAVPVQAAPAKPGGRVFFNAHRLLLVGWRLAPLPVDRTYEMWLLPRHGPPVPAGLFRADAAGSALHLSAGDWSQAAAVAVSVEPAGGRPQPTGPIVLVAKLPGQ